MLVSAFAVAIGAQAQAQETRPLGTFGKWSAYAVDSLGDPLCYMASKPIKAEGKYTKRGKIWALVSHRPRQSHPNIVQFVAGYTFKKGSEVKVVVDRKTTFTLFTDEEDAWAYDGEDERLIKAMKRGRRMVVRGVSWRGTKTKDSYSLHGFTKAYDEVKAACHGR